MAVIIFPLICKSGAFIGKSGHGSEKLWLRMEYCSEMTFYMSSKPNTYSKSEILCKAG